ncbi:MAG: Lrp/AsnC family transcriptional regulator [Nanoarchaeota archaeon]|nr:Lrp/AsnC family transcriptional regulator [Nanoarchaeota archaeon]
MNKKLCKLLFILSENSRITTQALSKKIHSSQQSASYMINQLRKKKIIQDYNTIVDPVKLGFTNILVGLNYLVFDAQTKKDILNELKNNNSIVSIQEGSQGIDLLLEYCVNNLSAFNKIHSEIAQKLHKNIETKFIYPIVVKHKFKKKYLINSKENTEEMVLCGDRETRTLTTKELEVLKELVTKSDITYSKLSQKTKMAAKTIVNIKKRLEKDFIIRGYSCVFNYQKLNINRQIIFLNMSEPGIKEMNKLISYCSMHKNITETVKIIGPYHIIIITESIKETKILEDLRSTFAIKDYFITNIKNLLKTTYIPENL